MNKIIISLLLSILGSAYAQDVASLLSKHQDRAYSPKFKALNDLVIDIEIPSLTKQLNEQMILGAIKELTFRIYWTATPERIAIEINGLPEGFNEIKNELKQAVLAKFETVIPINIEKKFIGYKLKLDSKTTNTVIAIDEKALNAIPEYRLNFGKDGVLETIVGKKAIGTLETSFKWERAEWSDPRLFTKKSIMKSVDGPVVVNIETDIEWTAISNIGLPAKTTTLTYQKIEIPNSEAQHKKTEEIVIFKNHKVNIGEALKWFLANNSN